MKSLAILGRGLNIAPREGLALAAEEAPPRVPCSYCNDLGMIKWDAPPGHALYQQWFICDNPKGCEAANELRARRAETLFELSGVPGDYRYYTFETFESEIDADKTAGKEIAVEILRDMAAQSHAGYYVFAREIVDSPEVDAAPRNWVVLYGSFGKGKTGLACSLVNAVLAMDREAVYYRLSNLFREVQRRYDSDKENEDYTGSLNEFIQRLQTVELLVIDEFRVENESADKRQILQNLIRERAARKLATVITCNETPEQLKVIWGEATIDPILEACHWITMRGEKIRRDANYL